MSPQEKEAKDIFTEGDNPFCSDGQVGGDQEVGKEGKREEDKDGGDEGRGGRGGARKRGPVAEILWEKHIRSSGSLGWVKAEDGQPMVYQKIASRWSPVINQKDVRSMVTDFLLSKAKKMYSARSVRDCEYVTDSLVKSVGVSLREEDKRCIFTVENGVIEVENDGRIRFYNNAHNNTEFARTVFRTHIPVSVSPEKVKGGYYQPDSDDKIEESGYLGRLLSDAFPNVDVRRTFQEFFGDTISPIPRKAFVVMIGEQDSGKSQVLRLASMLHLNSHFGDLSELRGFELGPYLGKSLVVIDELGTQIDETIFKRIVGGAATPIKLKFKDTISARLKCKFLGGANKMFRVSEKGGAVETRLYIFPVGMPTGELIDDLATKIATGFETKDGYFVPPQLEQVMDWALNGLSRVYARGRLLRHSELPEACFKEKKEMQAEANPCIEWIDEAGIEITGQEGGLVPKIDVYHAFRAWALDRGMKNYGSMTQAKWAKEFFKVAMDMKFGKSWSENERKASAVIDGKSVRVMCYPVKFTNAHLEKKVSDTEARQSYDRPDAYEGKAREEVEKRVKGKGLEILSGDAVDEMIASMGYTKVKTEFGEAWEIAGVGRREAATTDEIMAKLGFSRDNKGDK